VKWLLLAVLMDSVFGQAFKLGQRRGFAAPWVVGGSFLSLGICLSLFLAFRGSSFPPLNVVLLGLVMGSMFLIAMLIYNHALHKAPVGMVVTTFRMGIVIPMVIGVAVWDESLTILQGLGVSLAIFALFLMTRPKGATSWLPNKELMGLLLILFGMQGLCYTLMRGVEYWGFGEHHIALLAVIGLTGGGLGFSYANFKGGQHRRKSSAFGVLIGAYNSFTLPVILIALSYLPGTQYFPLAACGAVILDNLCAHFIWRENLTTLNVAGVITALVSLILIIE
jgi:multidrug transporter EmrE-like cation transporter